MYAYARTCVIFMCMYDFGRVIFMCMYDFGRVIFMCMYDFGRARVYVCVRSSMSEGFRVCVYVRVCACV